MPMLCSIVVSLWVRPWSTFILGSSSAHRLLCCLYALLCALHLRGRYQRAIFLMDFMRQENKRGSVWTAPFQFPLWLFCTTPLFLSCTHCTPIHHTYLARSVNAFTLSPFSLSHQLIASYLDPNLHNNTGIRIKKRQKDNKE